MSTVHRIVMAQISSGRQDCGVKLFNISVFLWCGYGSNLQLWAELPLYYYLTDLQHYFKRILTAASIILIVGT